MPAHRQYRTFLISSRVGARGQVLSFSTELPISRKREREKERERERRANNGGSRTDKSSVGDFPRPEPFVSDAKIGPAIGIVRRLCIPAACDKRNLYLSLSPPLVEFQLYEPLSFNTILLPFALSIVSFRFP